jgi:hypothetical protein
MNAPMPSKLALLKMQCNLVYGKANAFLLAAEIIQEQRVLLQQALALLDQNENTLANGGPVSGAASAPASPNPDRPASPGRPVETAVSVPDMARNTGEVPGDSR